MNWLWIPFVFVGSGMGLTEILRPAWLTRGQELTESKRDKIRDQGMMILGLCAIIAWPGILGVNFPYVFGPIALLWLIENFKKLPKIFRLL